MNVPKVTESIVVNISSGAYVNVSANIPARLVTIEEDPNNGASTGMTYQLPDDAFVYEHKLAPGEVLTLGNKVAMGNGYGPLQGIPVQNAPAAYAGGTTYAKDAIVLSGGLVYYSLAAGNVGNTPASNADKWQYYPQHQYRAATIYCKLKSQGAATKARMTETE